jgi:hypothetical protein
MLAISGPIDSMLGRAVAGSLGGGESSHKGPWHREQTGIGLWEGNMMAWMIAWKKRYAWIRLQALSLAIVTIDDERDEFSTEMKIEKEGICDGNLEIMAQNLREGKRRKTLVVETRMGLTRPCKAANCPMS